MAEKRVMVVEDEFIVANDIKNTLQRLGFAVSSTVGSGEEAVERASREKPDIVLMDIILRGEMDGIEAARQIGSRLGIPVVFLTSFGGEDVLQRARTAKPFGYLIKPFEDRELRATLEMALDKAALGAKLEESEKRFREFIEGTDNLVTQVDGAGRFTYVNHAAEKYFGLKPEECIGLSAFDFIPPESRERTKQWFDDCVRDRVSSATIENRQVSRTDEVRDMLWTSNFQFDESGKVLGVNGIARDITERKQAEDALKRSEANLAEAQRIAHLGSWQWIVATDRGYWSDETYRILGLDPKEFTVTLEAFYDYIHPDDKQFVQRAVDEALRERKPLEISYRILRPDGTQRTLNSRAKTEYDQSGAPVRMVGSIQDVTERQQALKTLQESEAKARSIAEYLRESEERFRIALKDSQITVFSQDLDLRYTWIYNPHPDLTVESVLGKTDGDLVSSEDAAYLTDLKRRVLQRGVGERDEGRFTIGSQPSFHAYTVEPLRNPAGEIIGIIGASTEITERKQAEEKIRQAKEDYDRIIDNADEAIFRVEAEGGHVVYANPAAERLSGYSQAEWLADPTLGLRIIHPDYAQAQKQIIEEINTSKKPVKNVTLGWIAKDGQEVIVEHTIIPVLDEEGKILFFESIGRDITERKRAEQMLVEEKHLSELLLDSLPYPSMLIRRDRTILAANRTAREAGAIVGGVCWQEFAHADYIPEQHKQYIQDHGCAPPDGSQCMFCLADKALDCQAFTNNPEVHAFGRIWDTRWFPLDDDVYLYYSIDITERVETERELYESRQRLAEAEKLASVGRVTARIAHEINNPMAGIKNGFRIVRENIPEDNPSGKYLKRIDKEIDRVAEIIRQMLDLHRQERELNAEISLSETVEEVVAMLEPLSRQHGVSIEVDLSRSPVVATLPENAVRQILYNLLANGVEASPRGDSVKIAVSTVDGAIRVAVADHGPGIPQELHQSIFEPFFTTKDEDSTGGLGLGLAISRSLAEAAHGSLTFENETDKGCEFRLTLPLITDKQGGNQ